MHQLLNKAERQFLFLPFLCEPPGAADRKVGAGWMRDHKIPLIVASRTERIANQMLPRPLARQQVARPGVMPKSGEGVADDPGELAGD